MGGVYVYFGEVFMNKSICTIVAFMVCIAGNITAGDQGEGHKRLAAHIAAAKKSKKEGIAASAAEGAKYGAGAGALYLGYNRTTDPYEYDYQLNFSNLISYLAVGAGLGAVTGMWADAFNSSSPAWLAQMNTLDEKKDNIEKDEVLLTGVPFDQVNRGLEKTVKTNFAMEMWWTGALKRIRKAYLLSAKFHNIEKAFDNDHYEIYFMPKNEELVDVFLAIDQQLQTHNNHVAFLAMRPTPGITKSPYNSKNMPRIILGFNNNTSKDAVLKVLQPLYTMLKEKFPNAMLHNATPRYSKKIDDLMYVAYGSADYKDGAGYKKPKTKTIFQWLWSGPSDGDMAFGDKAKEITIAESVPAFVPFAE